MSIDEWIVPLIDHQQTGTRFEKALRLKQVTTIDMMNGGCPDQEFFWLDHVMFDIPETLVRMVENAPANCVAITFHEYVFQLGKFEPVILACQQKGIHMVKALTHTYERIWNWK